MKINARKGYMLSNKKYDLLGLIVDNNEIHQNELNNISGVKVNSIKPNSLADENDIQIEDIIVSIGKFEINNITDYQNEINKYKIDDTIMLRIIRNKKPFYLAFEIN